MDKKKKFGVSSALSKGLTETIQLAENNLNIFRNTVIPINRLELDPENPRKLFLETQDVIFGIKNNDPQYEVKVTEYTKLKDFANTIQNNGILNPIIVYKHGENYRVVAGERRTLASLIAGKTEIDARVYNEKPTGYTLKIVQWIENTAREDLSLAERIDNILEIIQLFKHENQREINTNELKDITGLSNAQISCYMSVLIAPDDVKLAIKQTKINNLDKAAFIAKLKSEHERMIAIELCMAGTNLKNLKSLISSKQSSKKSNDISKFGKKGRTTSSVKLGTTTKINVVKLIIDTVLEKEKFQKHKYLFNDATWDTYDSVNQTFKTFLRMMEVEIK